MAGLLALFFASWVFFGASALVFILPLLMLIFLTITLTLIGTVMSYRQGLFDYPLSLPLFRR